MSLDRLAGVYKWMMRRLMLGTGVRLPIIKIWID
jgi:hypothetical protein